ncbi:MAG TPA: RNA-binding cell elongation regulator Jag/EloR [Dehalococcoidales bacterium]|nr:RNA-binding cell elongation regulator Jag/EloR [Dehalococcoidales bacterium]
MESLEINAKTVEEALQRALGQLGVSRDEVEVEVVKEGKSGILGIGAENAVVKVTVLEPDGNRDETPEVVRKVLEKLLDLMEIDATIKASSTPVVDNEEDGEASGALAFDVEGDDLGILIGRRGLTLASLQYLVRLIVGHQTDEWVPIIIDVEGYKARRYAALQDFARQMAEQVKTKGSPFRCEPMSPAERRLVHLALANDPDVSTESTGQGESRRVVILPRK